MLSTGGIEAATGIELRSIDGGLLAQEVDHVNEDVSTFTVVTERTPSDDEMSDLLRERGVRPNTQFVESDDYAVMAMVESGMGISLLHRLILKRTPYHFVARPLAEPAYRDIALALRSRQGASLAVQRFLDYLAYR